MPPMRKLVEEKKWKENEGRKGREGKKVAPSYRDSQHVTIDLLVGTNFKVTTHNYLIVKGSPIVDY